MCEDEAVIFMADRYHTTPGDIISRFMHRAHNGKLLYPGVCHRRQKSKMRGQIAHMFRRIVYKSVSPRKMQAYIGLACFGVKINAGKNISAYKLCPFVDTFSGYIDAYDFVPCLYQCRDNFCSYISVSTRYQYFHRYFSSITDKSFSYIRPFL